MSTIKNAPGPLASKATIEVIKDGPTSPVLGNLYIGKRATLDKRTAKALVDAGVAKFVDKKAEKAAAKKDDSKKEEEKPKAKEETKEEKPNAKKGKK